MLFIIHWLKERQFPNLRYFTEQLDKSPKLEKNYYQMFWYILCFACPVSGCCTVWLAEIDNQFVLRVAQRLGQHISCDYPYLITVSKILNCPLWVLSTETTYRYFFKLWLITLSLLFMKLCFTVHVLIVFFVIWLSDWLLISFDILYMTS